MEPWLDSLSEDWNSEPNTLSPAPSSANRSYDGTSSTRSQSRIPHLAQSLRKDSSTGSFLKPRSSRGIAKAKNAPILSERSASSLNVPAGPGTNGSAKNKSSTIPRRTSSAFSDSQQSVQHHTVNSTSRRDDTPEWKKRLGKRDEIASDGFDLFSPSKLEGIFSQHQEPKHDKDEQSSLLDGNTNPWSSLKLAHLPSSTEQYQSFRTSRSRAPIMEALQEVNEEDDERSDRDEDEHSLSAISSDIARDGSIRGLVKQRVDSFEQKEPNTITDVCAQRSASSISQDPRWRTYSGRQELRAELISPVTVSAQNTIRERALQNSADIDPKVLRAKLLETDSVNSKRPSSRSSDRDVSYTGQGRVLDHPLHEEYLPDTTSQSLPEDLSMGTELFVSNGGYINSRRGAPSNEASVLKHDRSSSIDLSHFASGSATHNSKFRSSPPPYNTSKHPSFNESHISTSSLDDLLDDSVVHHQTSPPKEPSSGSPLKLFGNRDTYTNNKLMRALSQFGQASSDESELSADTTVSTEQRKSAGNENPLRMSQFGKGELDTFNFEKQITREETATVENVADTDGLEGKRIFHGIAHLNLKNSPSRKKSPPQTFHGQGNNDTSKRLPSSPAKDRTPKRRRTLLKDEIIVEGVGVEIKIDQVPDKTTAIAGKKRKDARPGEKGSQADQAVLASRSILRPKAASRKSSAASQQRSLSQETVIAQQGTSADLAEALAAELESFAQGVSEAKQDSRKPSLATKDYMEEANKVMEFIRARGKPKSQLSEIHEPRERSELNLDSVLDLELDDDSTKDSFSRPPSRERPVKPKDDRRIAKHDPRVASHLKRYQEPDDLEILASTSVVGTLPPIDNQAADEAALVPVPGNEQESSPSNMRILNPDDTVRKKHHAEDATVSARGALHSDSSSTGRTFATGSTDNSGRKGIISSGTVSIPDQVGTMTFDHEQQIWVKQQLMDSYSRKTKPEPKLTGAHEPILEEDPFDNIPDLSIDEQREAAMRVVQKIPSGPVFAITKLNPNAPEMLQPTQALQQDECGPDKGLLLLQNSAEQNPTAHNLPDETDVNQSSPKVQHPSTSRLAEHEERLFEGMPSKSPVSQGSPSRQARVVTIAFSSPVASEIPSKKPPSTSDEEFDDESFWPPEDSENEEDVQVGRKPAIDSKMDKASTLDRKPSVSTTRHAQYRSMTLNRRPISRIDEDDEENKSHEEMSLVRTSNTNGPIVPSPDHIIPHNQTPAYKGTSILCLTPLSEFTMHQVDRKNDHEESFVAARPHPKALLQAHGTLNLAVDALVEAITDAAPTEPFWEQLRSLNLNEKHLSSLHGLQEYCPALEELFLANNSISQLNGLCPTIRMLNVRMNCINDFTSWADLQNLQYVDASDNQLESLGAFSSLLHLRELKVCNNKIQDIEGVLDLNGLISLDLSGNELTSLDFEGVDLPRLEVLDLSRNRLTTVRNLHCLPQLKFIRLDNNSLRELFIPENMPHLRILSVSHNEIEAFDLTKLPLLENLDIDDNCLRLLQGLSSANNLRRLSAREQRCSSDILNHILSTPNECEEVLLSSNVLANGQIKLPQLPHYNIRHLELSACGLQQLPQGFGDYFSNCHTMNLNFNAVQDLSPLIGCIKLRRLFLAGNRIKRLRRTCLTFARLPLLQQLDIRDNPLTVGFYGPASRQVDKSEINLVPRRLSLNDSKWLLTLDEMTSLRRRMVELLLAEQCRNLKDFDGLAFRPEEVMKQDFLWANLTTQGVLVKAIEAPPVTMEVSNAG